MDDQAVAIFCVGIGAQLDGVPAVPHCVLDVIHRGVTEGAGGAT